METISVIIPCYNASKTIVESANSVIMELENNDYDWEIIFIDDCSTDNTLEIITKNFGANSKYFDRIIIVKLENNHGVAFARNEGIKIAKGSIIAFNDSDDRWLEDKIKTQMDYLNKHPDISMVSGIFDKDRIDIVKYMDHETLITIKDQVFKNYFSPQCVMFRKSILKDIGLFNPQMRYAEEGYFFNNMVFYSKCILLRVKVVESITNKKRWGESGLSGKLWKMEKGELYNLRYALKSNYISFYLFVLAYLFSIAKFLRRLIIKKIILS